MLTLPVCVHVTSYTLHVLSFSVNQLKLLIVVCHYVFLQTDTDTESTADFAWPDHRAASWCMLALSSSPHPLWWVCMVTGCCVRESMLTPNQIIKPPGAFNVWLLCVTVDGEGNVGVELKTRVRHMYLTIRLNTEYRSKPPAFYSVFIVISIIKATLCRQIWHAGKPTFSFLQVRAGSRALCRPLSAAVVSDGRKAEVNNCLFREMTLSYWH